MNATKHKEWVESVINEEIATEINNPIDAWIMLALYCDEVSVRNLHVIVQSAVKRLKWELENIPCRWVDVREVQTIQLAYWVALQDKLRSLYTALDDIPF